MKTRKVPLAESRILIIDDEADTIEVLRRLLLGEGYRNIESTTEPERTLQLYEEFQPDLVILDWLMPAMMGAAVLAALRVTVSVDTLLPILVLSGDPAIETRRAALRHGASDFVAKPFDVTEILARIANLLETRALGHLKAQAETREMEERFTAAFEHAPIGVAMESPTGRYLGVNRAFCHLVGYSEAELLTKNFAEISHPECAERDCEHARRMLAGEADSYQTEKRFIHKDGQVLTVLLNVGLVRAAEGVPRYFITQVQDITERERAERATRESRRFLQSTLDALSSHIAILDEAGTIIEVNEAWRRFAAENDMVGGLRGVGDNYLRLCDAATGTFSEEAPLVAAGIRQVISGARAEFHLEYPCHCPREKRWFIVRVTRFAGAGPVRVVVAHENVTERKEAEEALRASEAGMAAAQAIVHLASWEMEFIPGGDRMLNPLRWSDEMFRIAGYEPRSVPVTVAFFYRLIPPEEREEVSQAVASAIREHKGYSIVHRFIRPDGSERIIHERAEVVYDKMTGQPLKMVGTAHDITDQRRIKEDLFQSRETLRRILDQIPQRVFWKDRDSVYLGCNRAFAADLGLADPAEIVGKTDLELSWVAVAERYRADDRAVMETNAVKLSFEEPGMATDGTMGWIRTSKTPLHDSLGRVTGVLGTYEDVTEHKLAKLEIERLNADLERRVAERTEDLLAATLEAERANQAKSVFLSRVSHELRTPLNAILGFGQLLEMEENLGAEPRESVEQVLAAGRHLLTLVNEVLDLTSAETRQLSTPLGPVLVGPLVEKALSLAYNPADPLRVQVVTDVPAGCPFQVLAHPARLTQALLNLLTNAIQYNRLDGSVVVSCFPMERTLPPALRILVRDTGPGISPDHLGRLFTPFDRLDADRTRRQIPGTGLGLTLSRALVEAMGGRLGVESTVGEGSLFWIELPLAG